MSDTARRLRAMLNGPEMVVAPFVFDAFQARLAQAAGFQTVYMTGFGTATMDAVCAEVDTRLEPAWQGAARRVLERSEW
ncbi:MAG: hypothetical protein HOP18_27605 [Deltaproteobacteria bacterium]|nr:hypothetical protein [Deltaproteobacteria bacterium]